MELAEGTCGMDSIYGRRPLRERIIESGRISFVYGLAVVYRQVPYNSTIIEDLAWRLMAAKTVYDFKKKERPM